MSEDGSPTLTTWDISALGGTATGQAKGGNLEALGHRGQVAGGKGLGGTQGYQEEIPIQPTPGTTPEAGRGPSKRLQTARCEVLPVENVSLSH